MDTSGQDASTTGTDARKRLWQALGVLFVLAAVVLLLRGLLTPATAGAPGNPAARATATPGPAAPLVGHYMPDATIRDLDDKLVPLSSYRGQVVVLNFWYVACTPCQIEMPALERAYLTYGRQGVVVVGIDIADTAGAIDDFTQHYGITYPILRDEGQRAIRTFRVTATPTSFIIDRQGVIRYISSGPLEQSVLTRQLSALVSAS